MVCRVGTVRVAFLSADGHHYPSPSQQGDEGIVGVRGPTGTMVSVKIARRDDFTAQATVGPGLAKSP